MKKLFSLGSTFLLFGLYAVFFAEGFLRLLAPQAIIPRYVTAAPYGVRMNVPNARYDQITPETRATIQINEQGLRADRPYSQTKPSKTKRILLFGDSYFLGYEADLEESFAWQLEKTLRQKNCPVEVLNFAVSGFGTAEMLRTLEKKGLSFAPDVVVFQWHHTDPADNKRANLYQLQNNSLRATGATYIPTVYAAQIAARLPLYKTISNHSQLYAASREKLGRFVKNIKTGGALVLATSPSTPGVTTRPDTLDQPDRPPSGALDLALLAQAAQQSRTARADFYVVDIPSVHSRTSFSSAFRLLPEALAKQANYITPINAFRAAAEPEKKLYWERGHKHLTALGNRLLADTVSRELIRQSSQTLACPSADHNSVLAPNPDIPNRRDL